MNEVRICIQGGGFGALAGAIAVSLPAAFTPAVAAQCNNPDPSPDCADASLGITGGFVQECDLFGGSDDPTTPELGDGWTSFAWPFQTGGANVDAVRFTLTSNRAGGDIWILGNTADPNLSCGQPDINNVLAQICCGLEPGSIAAGVVNTVPWAVSHASRWSKDARSIGSKPGLIPV